jgi:uncharacterized protein (TIGR00369 family)
MKLIGDDMCFACGKGNPIGLKLSFEEVDGKARASFIPLEEHSGYVGIVHGGIITTLLDEAMAYACIMKGIGAVTAEIRVRFRNPASPGERIEVEGEVVGRKGKVILAKAKAYRPDGMPIAEGEGKLIEMEGFEWKGG